MAKYIVLTTTDQAQLHVLKTTISTPGDGDWDSQDSSNSPRYTAAPEDAIISFWAYEFNSDIHIATQQASGRVAYHLFNPGDDTWTTVDEFVAAVGDTNFDEVPDQPGVSLSIRADGDVLVFYTYHQTTNDGDGILYAREEGSGWTNDILYAAAASTSAKANPVAIGPDSSDIQLLTHCT